MLGSSLTWQNDLRQKMGFEPADALHLWQILMLAVAVFAVAFLIGRLVATLLRLMRARFYRVMPPRRANVLGFVTIAAFLVIVTRDGLFDRVVLIVASPTGTGWLDPGSHDPVEYMHGGDIATVAAQYSYLQSPLALILETRTGLEQATALQEAVHGYWKTLPPDARPRLYVHGLSLGA